MDETIEQEEVRICQACNKVIEKAKRWTESSNSISFTLNGKELALMHFDCYTKGCLWAAKQAYEREQESDLHWSWDYDDALNTTKDAITNAMSEYISIKQVD